MWDAVVDGDEDPPHNPMLITTSNHYIGDGSLELLHPSSWLGNSKGLVNERTFYFTPNALRRSRKRTELSESDHEWIATAVQEIWIQSGL
jgi:hypothetical protein